MSKNLLTPKPRKEWHEVWCNQSKKLVLFDLDGTLLDTSGDLGSAANLLRKERDLPPLKLDEYKSYVSRGAAGMLERSLNIGKEDVNFDLYRKKFLSFYSKNLLKFTDFMPGMNKLICSLEEAGIIWGIVTNKYHEYAMPIIHGLNLDDRAAILVCGDTLAYSKPHPAPIRYAFEKLCFDSRQVIYVGDDPRDIKSGFNAGCWTIAISFETTKKKSDLAGWGSDAIAINAKELADLLNLQLALN